jgi:hypothetical protein
METIVVVFVAIACVLTAALCVLGALGWFTSDGRAAARSTAETFLGDVERGDDSAAYALLCPETAQQFELRQFTQAIERLPRPRSHKITDAFFSDEAGRHVLVIADLIDGVGLAHAQTIPVDQVGKGWGICGDPL